MFRKWQPEIAHCKALAFPVLETHRKKHQWYCCQSSVGAGAEERKTPSKRQSVVGRGYRRILRHQRLSSSLRAPTGASCCLSPTQRKSVKDPTWLPPKELASTGQECRIDLEVRTTGWGTKQKARTLYLRHILNWCFYFSRYNSYH